jgi:thiamine-monophosphate kinase
VATERELIERIAAAASRRSDDVILGIGDDAAIIRTSSDRWWLVTTDSQVEDVHFKLDYTPARLLGHKALAVNLSDIAAMGGTPRFALLSLALPKTIEPSFVDELLAGMLALADQHTTILIGGDIAGSGDGVKITMTLIGECPARRAGRRDGAGPGDLIYVTGTLGLSAIGLRLLQRGYRYADDLPAEIKRAILAHLAPTPRLDIGRYLAEREMAHAMIDISDGLSTDLFHLCEASRVGAVVYGNKVPVATGIPQGVEAGGLENALNGGEDYELLFTVAKDRAAWIEEARAACADVPITHIGEIIDEPGRMFLDREGALESLLPRGYDHLRTE